MARINKCVSMYKDEIEQLKWICSDTGMSEADVIRELINKAYIDKYCREIITKENFTKKAIKAKLGKTSHNVHYENEENGEASHDASPKAVSFNSQQYDNVAWGPCKHEDEWDKDIQHTLEVAKTRWVDPNF